MSARTAAAVTIATTSAIATTSFAHVLLTPASEPTRVLVLNMHAGKDAAGKSNLDAIVALVKKTGADLVLLQEVDRGTARSGNVDQVNVLGTSLKFATAFAASLLHYDGGQYGIATLARGFIGYSDTWPLPVTPVQTRAGGSNEPRVALIALATLKTGELTSINTHLDPADGPARAQEVTHLVDAIHGQYSAGGSFVVGGDFNSTPDNPVLAPLRNAGLRDAWVECGSGDGFTYPADKPAKRIDYLFLTGALHCSAATVIDTQILDHRPLLVTLK